MENKTKGAGDDYPVIPQVKEELCPTCGSAWGNINGMYCSNSFHLATPAIQKELAFLKEVVKDLLTIAETQQKHLQAYGKVFPNQSKEAQINQEVIDRAKRLSDNK